MIQKRLIILLLLSTSAGSALGQSCDLNLKGKVLHQENDEPIEAAYIWIKEINSGAVSDQNGNFVINDLCKGTYTIMVKYLGHEEIRQAIMLEGSSLKQTFRMQQKPMDIAGVEIHGHQDAIRTTSAINALNGEALLEARGQNLGEVLKKISGVTSYSTGSTISKPVIHGMHSNRIMILNNGIRLEGQQWGSEHAPEIDPFLADEITVVKGAETVRFGPEAIGGVILVDPPSLPVSEKHETNLHLIAATNGRMGNISIAHTGGSGKLKGLGYRIQASAKRAGNIKSPEYYQGNTGMAEHSFSGALGYSTDDLGMEVYYSFFNTQLGILTDSHTGNLTDLTSIIKNGRPFTNPSFNYEINNPKQKVVHHLAKLKAHYHFSPHLSLNFQYGFQLNSRQEYDKRRGSLNAKPGLDLELFTNTLDLSLEHRRKNHWSGTIGFHVIQQANNNIPGTGVTPLIPNYDMIGSGAYLIEKYLRGPLELEGGLRFDLKYINGARYINNELQTAELDYRNISAFLGGLYHLSPRLTFSSNLGSAWRPPNINELFSQGLHHGAAAVEIGDPGLMSEKSLKWINSLKYESNKVLVELTAYTNHIRNYIYLNPTRETYVSLRGTFNVYEYLQAKAFFYGMDISGSYSFPERWEAYAKASLIRAKNTDTDGYFPFIPSDRMDCGVSYSMGKKTPGAYSDKITLSGILVARQSREPDFDLSPAPSAYALLNTSYHKKLNIARKTLGIGLQINNLLGTEYREYMNRFRYFTADMGRNITLKLNYQF